MEKKICVNCEHYRIYYVKDPRLGDYYWETMNGHCIFPRLKHRDANTPACVHFAEKKP